MKSDIVRPRIIARRGVLLSLGALASAPLALAAPTRAGWVTDEARALTDAQRSSLDAELASFARGSGHELAVVTVASLEGKSIEDFSIELAKGWNLGRAGKDNGVLLLLAPRERKMRIETGKGVGDRLTDLQSNDILTRVMRPRLQAGDAAGALVEGARAIQKALGQPPAQQPKPIAPPVSMASEEQALLRKLCLGGAGLLVGLGLVVRWISDLVARRRRRNEARDERRRCASSLDAALAEIARVRSLYQRQQKALPPRAGRLLVAMEARAESLQLHLGALDSFEPWAPEARSARGAAQSALRKEQPERELSLLLGLADELASQTARNLEKQYLARLDEIEATLKETPLKATEQRALSGKVKELRAALQPIHQLEIGALQSLEAGLREMRQLSEKIAQGAARFAEQPARISQLSEQLDRQVDRFEQAAREAREIRERYPNEPTSELPDLDPLLGRARSAILAALRVASDRSQTGPDSFEARFAEAKAAMDALEPAIHALRTFEARRGASVFSLASTFERLERLVERASSGPDFPRYRGPVSSARALITSARAALDRGASFEACRLAEKAEKELRKALGEQAEPVASSASSHDSGSSSSSHDSGGSSGGHGSSSSGGYDSSSSGGYDSSSSGGYDSGGSSGGYDSGGSSGGGGDYGGGGSSSDW